MQGGYRIIVRNKMNMVKAAPLKIILFDEEINYSVLDTRLKLCFKL